jgi:hypothetical protein
MRYVQFYALGIMPDCWRVLRLFSLFFPMVNNSGAPAWRGAISPEGMKPISQGLRDLNLQNLGGLMFWE